jgi:polyisoprenoid-binding protein YceI
MASKTGTSTPPAGYAVQLPGFTAGTWDIDPMHTEVSFTIGHLVVSKVRGRFDAYSGTIVINEDLDRSSVTVTIDASSVDTHLPIRDNQIRSADFLDVEHFPNITFVSTAVRYERDRYLVDGDLSIRGTTLPVTLDTSVNGFSPDSNGLFRVSFSAAVTINRLDFGVSYNSPIPGLDNKMTLSDDVVLTMDVEAILQTSPPTA